MMDKRYGENTQFYDGKARGFSGEMKFHNENSKGVLNKIKMLEKKLSGLKETLTKINKSVPNKAMAAANVGQVGMMAAAEGVTEKGEPVMKGESQEFEGMKVTNESLERVAGEGARRQAEYDKEYYSPSGQLYQKLLREAGKLTPEQQNALVKEIIKGQE